MARIPVEIGQVSIFDIPVNEAKPKIKEIVINLEESILSTYKDKAIKIIRSVAGRYLIFIGEEILHISKDGKEDFRSLGSPSILPMDSILFSVKDEPVNELQNRRLEQFSKENDVDKVIKRFGDQNYIVITKEGNTIGINPKGWVIPYESKAVYKNSEIKTIRNNFKGEDKEKVKGNNKVKVGSEVEVTYEGNLYQGIATRIYGPSNTTINVTFDGKNTAFYKENVKLVS